MKFLKPILFVALSLSSATLPLRAEETRFSKTLTAVESTDLSLAKLNSDQVAVLDALVRRDIAAADYVTKEPRAPRFSQRLSADERRNSGLDTLSSVQLTRLDTLVERLMPSATPVVVTPATSGPVQTIPSVKINRGPEIHGSVSLMFGAGSHGFSERGGAMVLTYQDPSSGLGIAVGYSEVRTKGGYLLRNCQDRYDPFGWSGGPGW